MSNYNKTPYFSISGKANAGWDAIINHLSDKIKYAQKQSFTLVIECYQGVDHTELIQGFKKLNPDTFISSEEAFKSEAEILKLTYPDVTDDAIFGFITRLKFDEFLETEKVIKIRNTIKNASGLTIIYGPGSSIIAQDSDCLVYADMARWEIQQRQRNHKVTNLGLKNALESPSIQYKRGYFVDWRVCDKLKQKLFDKADFWLDSNKKREPKMISAETLRNGLNELVQSPFRVVPYFDPGPWGGQWMKEHLDLDKSKANFAWSFDGVPEENSLLLEVSGEIIEIPSINLVFYKSKELLGAPVESRFGKEFPIRFDFLDTMSGGNLSLQVHPTTQYIREKFGMNYTQDESYYILDAKSDATVLLGLKTDIDREEMITALKESQKTGTNFDAEKYVNVFPAKKHDHFLIPNGTIHCSGANSMVLEISATPYIFTFKLYDWGRMGLDGKPRAINIERGEEVIDWDKDTEYCKNNLVGQVEQIAQGDGWREERTGLHKTQFIETRRHWFTKPVVHQTGDSVNVLNLVQGKKVIVDSPTNSFKPFEVNYAETFIVPAIVKEYVIRPADTNEGEECVTIKAYVRFKE